MKNEEYKKLEAKLDALAHYLKVQVVAEKDSEEGYYEVVVKPYDKNHWSNRFR